MGKKFRPYWAMVAAMSGFVVAVMLLRGDFLQNVELGSILVVMTVLFGVLAAAAP